MKVKTSLSLEEIQLEKLKIIAKREKRSVSQLVEMAVDVIAKIYPSPIEDVLAEVQPSSAAPHNSK